MMPLPGSLLGFPPTPTDTSSSVIAWPLWKPIPKRSGLPGTHTQRPQGPLDIMWEKGSASPGVPQVLSLPPGLCKPVPFVLSLLPVPPSPSHMKEVLGSLESRNPLKRAPGFPRRGPYGSLGRPGGRGAASVLGFLLRSVHWAEPESFYSIGSNWQHFKERAGTHRPAP